MIVLSRFKCSGVFAGILLCWLSCASCSLSGDVSDPVMRLVSWNVQTLFDGEADGNEYEDYGADSGWNTERFMHRLETLREAFDVLCAAGVPTLFVLQELENEASLGALRETCLGGRGYCWQAWAGLEGAALGIGLLSRVPLSAFHTHALACEEEAALRPILECVLEAPGAPMRIFACHWKSKLGGADKTEYLRCGAASLINRRIAALKAAGDTLPILVVGDLNCNTNEFERRGGSTATALLPLEALDAGLPGSGQSILIGQGTGEYAPDGRLVFRSPWYDAAYEGSYYFAGDWEQIDHILMDPGFFDRSGWVYRGFSVFETSPFVRDGVPFRYSAHNGLGLSDHLPIAADFIFLEAAESD